MSLDSNLFTFFGAPQHLGAITDLNTWSKVLSEEEMDSWIKCGFSEGDIISWTTIKLEEETKEIDIDEICREGVQYIKFKSLYIEGFEDTIRLCRKIGGKVVTPPSRRELGKINEISQGSSFYLGYTDEKEEGIWRNVYDDRLLDFDLWFADFPHNKTKDHNCAVSHFSSVMDDLCSGNKDTNPVILTSPICELPSFQKFRMRGAYDAEIDTGFTLVNSTFFQGFFKSNITFDEKSNTWQIYNAFKETLVAYTNTTRAREPPLGLLDWHFLEGSKKLMFHFAVEQPGNFVCDDGFYIGSEQVCDGIPVCQNGEDEKDCELVSKPEYYNPTLTPMNAIEDLNGIKFLETNISVNVTIMDILNVDEGKSSFEIYFILRLSWFDKELSFPFLKENEERNKIDRSVIWSPKIQFFHAKEMKMLRNNLNVIRGAPQLWGRRGDENLRSTDIHVVDIFDGEDSPLLLLQESRATFSCSFSNIEYYPFKEQECHFNFFQDGEANYLMHFDLKEVKYDGPRRIGQFIVKKWTIQNSIDRTQVEKRFLK